MATKLTITNPGPFKLNVDIPLPGGDTDKLELTVKHRTRTKVRALQRADATRRAELVDRFFPAPKPAPKAASEGGDPAEAPEPQLSAQELEARHAAFDEAVVRLDAELLLDIAQAWEFSDALTLENALAFVDAHVGAMPAIVRAYYTELTEARLGN
jgi:hypothetical protein